MRRGSVGRGAGASVATARANSWSINELRSLNEAMRELDQNNLEGFREDIDLFGRIRNTLPRITDVLRSLDTLHVEQHQAAGFDASIQAVQGRAPRKS